MSSTTSKIIRASWVSIVGNFILAVMKVFVGLVSGSIAVVSDGIDSASDVVISIVMLVTARVMNRPPNERFAYGYQKAEGIATKMLSFIIFYAGGQMFLSALGNLISPQEHVLPEMIAIYVTLVSIVGKLLLSIYQTRAGKRYNSAMLLANGVNMRNDIITSISVLVGLGFTFMLELPLLDTITALLVSLMIMRSAIGIFRDSSIQLMDGVDDIAIYEKIFAAVDAVPQAHNPHRVRSRAIGNLYAIVLDIEVEESLTVRESHLIAHEVESRIKDQIPEIFDIVVHVEPLGDQGETEAYGVTQRP